MRYDFLSQFSIFLFWIIKLILFTLSPMSVVLSVFWSVFYCFCNSVRTRQCPRSGHFLVCIKSPSVNDHYVSVFFKSLKWSLMTYLIWCILFFSFISWRPEEQFVKSWKRKRKSIERQFQDMYRKLKTK